MKQEYRHTKPYRGKDPNFEKEEIQIWSGLDQTDKTNLFKDLEWRKKIRAVCKTKREKRNSTPTPIEDKP
jgi:hypothetical protein|tara:strand:- start:625 stop:834 length:210 start_codon:yes stop_codon:yes gene_type:complete